MNMNSSDAIELLIGGLVCFMLVITGVLIFLDYKEGQEWEKFKVDHNCKVVAKVKGEVFNTVGIDAKGNVSVGVGSTSDKVGWQCDDGVTHYR